MYTHDVETQDHLVPPGQVFCCYQDPVMHQELFYKKTHYFVFCGWCGPTPDYQGLHCHSPRRACQKFSVGSFSNRHLRSFLSSSMWARALFLGIGYVSSKTQRELSISLLLSLWQGMQDADIFLLLWKAFLANS